MFALDFVKVIDISRYNSIIFQTKITNDIWLPDDYIPSRLYNVPRFDENEGACTKGENSNLNVDLEQRRKLFDEGHTWF